jgi:CheY-like chemotaxis protein
MQILIVDDDPFAGEMASAILEAAGHACQLVESAIEALEILAEPTQPIELVISDMHMPLLNGLDFFEELRGRGIMTPFVLLSGDDAEPLRARMPGLADCLVKDASLEETLPESVDRLSGRV